MRNIDFKVRDRIERHVGDATPFDAVVSIETIEHLDPESGFGPLDFLREAYRLISANGLLIISTPEGKEGVAVNNPWHMTEFTKDQLTKMVKDAGFTDVKFDGWMPGFLSMTARRPGVVI